jgi:hypothetical protein
MRPLIRLQINIGKNNRGRQAKSKKSNLSEGERRAGDEWGCERMGYANSHIISETSTFTLPPRIRWSGGKWDRNEDVVWHTHGMLDRER